MGLSMSQDAPTRVASQRYQLWALGPHNAETAHDGAMALWRRPAAPGRRFRRLAGPAKPVLPCARSTHRLRPVPTSELLRSISTSFASFCKMNSELDQTVLNYFTPGHRRYFNVQATSAKNPIRTQPTPNRPSQWRGWRQRRIPQARIGGWPREMLSRYVPTGNAVRAQCCYSACGGCRQPRCVQTQRQMLRRSQSSRGCRPIFPPPKG